MIRKGLTAVLMLCAAMAAQAQVHRVRLDSVEASSEPAAGYWRVAPGGAIFICEPRQGHSGSYNLRMLYSPELGIAPGTFFGTMTPSGSPGVYEAALMLNPANFKEAEHRRTFTIEMDDAADRMMFKAYHNNVKVNFRRLLPYFSRVSVYRENTRPNNIDGAVRIDGEIPGAANIVIL